MNDFYEDTELICEQIFNNDFVFLNTVKEFQDLQLYKKISDDINHNIDLITDEYEVYYPGIKLQMIKFFDTFKTYSRNYFNVHQKNLISHSNSSKTDFSTAYNYRAQIAAYYGISRRQK